MKHTHTQTHTHTLFMYTYTLHVLFKRRTATGIKEFLNLVVLQMGHIYKSTPWRVDEQTSALRGPANTRVVQLFCRCWWCITLFNRHWNVSSAWSLPNQYFSLCCSSCLRSSSNGFVGCIVYLPRRAHTPPTCRPSICCCVFFLFLHALYVRQRNRLFCFVFLFATLCMSDT